MDVTQGGEGFNRPGAGAGFGKMLAMPSLDAFFDPEPRLELMKEMGIDRTLLWPTLASALEERMANDPDAVCVVIHALNEWMHEHWTYVYSDAIYSTPIISLAAGNDVALAELEWIAERGARIFLIRVAPVPTWKGRKSFALPAFDPFWEAGRRARPRGGHALGRRRLQPLHQRVGGSRRQGDGDHREVEGAPVVARVPRAVVGEGQPRRRDGVDHRARPRHSVPHAQVHAGRVRQLVD